MNASAVIQSSRHVAALAPLAPRGRRARSGRGRSRSGVNAVKSCVPGQQRARTRAARRGRCGCGQCSARPRSNALGVRRREHAVAVGPRAGVAPRVEAVGRRAPTSSTATSGGVSALRPRSVARAARRTTGDLAPRVHAAVGAPGDGEVDRRGAAAIAERAPRARPARSAARAGAPTRRSASPSYSTTSREVSPGHALTRSPCSPGARRRFPAGGWRRGPSASGPGGEERHGEAVAAPGRDRDAVDASALGSPRGRARW